MKTSRVVAVALMLLTAGCFGPRRVNGPGESHPPSAAQIPNVPFFADTTDQCGPSTLAAILSFWGHPTTPAELKKEIYLPKLKGTLPMDMVSAVEARGLKADGVNGTLERLKAELLAGRPVLAYVDNGYSFYPMGHYVVVTGFDDARQGVTLHSAGKENEFASYRKFTRAWDKTDRWMLQVSSS